jgi:hypothetical protein
MGKSFYNCFDMSANLYFVLENMVADEVWQQNTNYRHAIPTDEWLAIFLRSLKIKLNIIKIKIYVYILLV